MRTLQRVMVIVGGLAWGLSAYAAGPTKTATTVDHGLPEAVAPNTPQALKERIYDDLRHLDLVTAGNSLYVDIEREVMQEQVARERRADLGDLGQELSGRVDEMRQLHEELQKPRPDSADGLLAKSLQGKLNESEALRTQLETQMQDQIKLNENLKLLVTLYESLKAEEAAGLIKHLPPNVALQMIRMMSPRKSSKILSVMEPRLAAEISKRLIRTPSPSAGAVAKGAS